MFNVFHVAARPFLWKAIWALLSDLKVCKMAVRTQSPEGQAPINSSPTPQTAIG